MLTCGNSHDESLLLTPCLPTRTGQLQSTTLGQARIRLALVLTTHPTAATTALEQTTTGRAAAHSTDQLQSSIQNHLKVVCARVRACVRMCVCCM